MDTWGPPDEVGLRRVGEWFAREAPTLWAFGDNFRPEQGDQYLPPIRPPLLAQSPLRERCEATWSALARDFGRESLDSLLCDLYFFNDRAGLRPSSSHPTAREWALYTIPFQVARRWLVVHCTTSAVERLGEHLCRLLTSGLQDAEPGFSQPTLPSPDVAECAQLLSEVAQHPAASAVLRSLVRGEWDVPLVVPERLARALPDWALSVQEARPSGTYGYFGSGLAPALFAGQSRMAGEGLLDYETFRTLARRTPYSVPSRLLDGADHPEDADPLRALTLRLLWETVQEADSAEASEILERFQYSKLQGGRFLARACEILESRQVALISAESSSPSVALYRVLAGITGLEPGESWEDVTRRLAAFSRDTLLCVLPFAGAGRRAVLRCLGWESGAPLLELIDRIRDREFEGQYGRILDVPNCSDSRSGAIEHAELRRAIAEAGEEATRGIVDRLRQAQVGAKNSLFLVEAAAGWNEKEVKRGLRQHGQINLKALGLLPLAGPEEALDRYRLFREVERDCRKWGAERQANTRAAVEAGLFNLAGNADFRDVASFEWAMEARLASAAPLVLESGDYRATIELDRFEPRLVIRRQGKALSAGPAALRKHADWNGLKEALSGSRAQMARFKVAFERMMVEGYLLEGAALRDLARLPAARACLASLLVERSDAEFGFLADGFEHVLGADGAARAVAKGVRLAHPMTLRSRGDLRHWQGETVRLARPQPFKQLFREVYVPTPAEAVASASARFSGHVLTGRVASRLLQARGWEILADDDVMPFKRFRSGFRAWFDFPRAGHFLAENEVVTSGEVSFTVDPPVEGPQVVRLGDVPAVVLSETFRDADLVVSVARTGDDVWSQEAYERRGEAVLALAGYLGAKDVRCEGRFARVVGSRAAYRVHLGSASVFIEPSDALCILPAPGAAKAVDVCLPFAEDDERMAEVVAKVVLLSNDEGITDVSILAQIAEARRMTEGS